MIRIISLYLAILTTHVLLVYGGNLPGEFRALASVDLFLAALFCGGLLIAAPGVAKGAENFSIRFLLVTTMQMLMMLALILVLVYAKLVSPKTTGFSAIILFVILLAIQSVYFIRLVNRK